MEYLGQTIPKLGFGLMRLPMLGQEVDIEQTKQMVDRFMQAGFTYFAGNDQYEVETGIYHKAARFYFSMNVEGEN